MPVRPLTDEEAVEIEQLRIAARCGSAQAELAIRTTERFSRERALAAREAYAIVRRWWINLSQLEQPQCIRGGRAA